MYLTVLNPRKMAKCLLLVRACVPVCFVSVLKKQTVSTLLLTLVHTTLASHCKQAQTLTLCVEWSQFTVYWYLLVLL